MVPCGGVSLPYVFFDEAFTTITEEDGDVLIGISVLNPVSDAVVEVSIFGGDATEGSRLHVGTSYYSYVSWRVQQKRSLSPYQ
jgi:hypothetical protein